MLTNFKNREYLLTIVYSNLLVDLIFYLYSYFTSPTRTITLLESCASTGAMVVRLRSAIQWFPSAPPFDFFVIHSIPARQ
jgi:hypothetical protein